MGFLASLFSGLAVHAVTRRLVSLATRPAFHLPLNMNPRNVDGGPAYIRLFWHENRFTDERRNLTREFKPDAFPKMIGQGLSFTAVGKDFNIGANLLQMKEFF